jgi:ribosomal protein S6--L-glutamate ligase
MALAIVAHQREPTNATLALHLGARLLSPRAALAGLRRGDHALTRIDVRRTLDGVEAGLDLVEALELRGIHVLNRAPALLTVHDKLRTARALRAAGVPHPWTEHVRTVHELLELEPPFVVKPRFGSWGRDVVRCRDRTELEAWAVQLQRRVWFRRTGAIVQELLPPPGHDLRLLVARGHVFGGVERVAQPGEWRTNVSLGAARRHAHPPEEARDLALAAAAAVDIDVAGVDLLPVDGSYVPLELNGAADFDEVYSLDGDIYRALRELLLPETATV